MQQAFRPPGMGRLVRLAVPALLLLACGLAPPPTATPVPPTGTTTAPAAAAPAPTPTETPVPTISPQPAPTESPPKVLYEERFDDDATCFKTRSLDVGIELGIADGAYHIRVEGENGFNTLCIGGYDDFVLEYKLRILAAGRDSLIGLIFRQYVGSSYNLYLTGIREFCWDRYDAELDAFIGLAGCWEQLPEGLDLQDDLDIRVIAAQEQMAVIINEAFVAAVYDYALDYGSFGFFVSNPGSGATDILIDDIVIREIRQSDIDVFRSTQTGY